MEIARNLADAARNFTTPARVPERTPRLRTDEPVPDGIRRIARGHLQDAREELDETPARRLGEAVHTTRKRLKRLRACVRLSRDAIGEATYDRENTTLRMAGRRISAQRDAQVLVETLDALTERFADELAEDSTAALRERLEEDRKAAAASLRDGGGDDGGGPIAATRAAIDETLARTPTWAFERDDFGALSPGLRRIYRRGRRDMRAAREEPSAEHLHEWRKRVKDLWYAAEIVRPAQPKQLKRVAKRAHRLSSQLGDHHDLHVLRGYVVSHPQCFDSETHRLALLAVIDRRAARLYEQALARGRKLYGRKPKRFVREIERGWRKRAAVSATPRRSA
jgi:CHAD domain-containing protein